MLRLSPAVGYALRSVGGWRSIHWRAAAVETWELAPAEDRENARPLCIDGQLEKAQRLDHGPAKENLPRLLSTTLRHKATTAHLLKNVDLAGTSLFSGRMHHFVSDRYPPIFSHERVAAIPRAVFASAYSGNRWFGHFILDTSPLCLMAWDVARERGMEVVMAPFVTDSLGQRRRYLELLDIEARGVSSARFDELVIVDPLGLNRYHRSKFEEIRRRIRKSIRASLGDHKVYLRRGSHGDLREPENVSEIEAVLSEHGFHILDPSSMKLDALVAALLDARVILGVEGSQLTHALPTAADRATLLTLQPPRRFGTPLKVYAEQIGLRWGFLIGQQRSGESWVVDLDELRRTLDLAL